jgi:hypothetical protein
MDTFTFHPISGSEIIKRFGYRHAARQVELQFGCPPFACAHLLFWTSCTITSDGY